jgi:hypothetical protein
MLDRTIPLLGNDDHAFLYCTFLLWQRKVPDSGQKITYGETIHASLAFLTQLHQDDNIIIVQFWVGHTHLT